MTVLWNIIIHGSRDGTVKECSNILNINRVSGVVL